MKGTKPNAQIQPKEEENTCDSPMMKHIRKRLTSSLKVTVLAVGKTETESKAVENPHGSPRSSLKRPLPEDIVSNDNNNPYLNKLLGVYNKKVYDKVLGVIGNMDESLLSKMRNSQDSILMAYKAKVSDIQKEMEELRSQLTEEKFRLERESKIRSLEKERDWLYQELQKSDVRLSKLDENFHKLQLDYEDLQADNRLLREQLFQIKRENKIIIQDREVVSSAFSPGAKFGFSGDRSAGRMSRLSSTHSQGHNLRENRNPLVEPVDARYQTAAKEEIPYTLEFKHISQDKTPSRPTEDKFNFIQKQLTTERKNNRILKAEKVRDKAKETE